MHPVFQLTPNAVIRLVQNVYKDQYVKFGLLHVFLTLTLKCKVDSCFEVHFYFGFVDICIGGVENSMDKGELKTNCFYGVVK